MARLTPKLELYAQNIARGVAKFQAAQSAGYKSGTLPKSANDNQIQARIREIKAELKLEDVATLQERKLFWTKVMNGHMFKASVKDQLRASELLGRAEGDFTDRSININLSNLTDEQVVRLSQGEPLTKVLAEP